MMFLSILLLLSVCYVPTYANERDVNAQLVEENKVIFSNLDALDVNESVELNITDDKGNPAIIGIQSIGGNVRADSQTWKVYFNSGVINTHFFMTVSNNRVTSVYDPWILVVGGTFSDDSLIKTSTYGKLSFNTNFFNGVLGAKCWLKGTVTGKNNDITVTWQM